VSKIAAAVLACVAFAAFSIPMSAQLIPNGNLYAGVSYGQLTNVVNTQSYRGWNGSAEFIPLARYRHFGVVLDGSGFYRSGITQYNGFGGLRVATNMGRWRPFVQGLGGIRHINSSGIINNPIAYDIGGGADYKLPFKNFSWRVQADYMHSHYLSATQNDYRASTGIVWRF
jgi:hypothetical protein